MSIGFAKLYAFHPMTGKSMWPDEEQAYTFDDAKIVGISSYSYQRDGKTYSKLLVAGSGSMGGTPLPLGGVEEYDLGEGFASGGLPDIPPMVPNLQYWREMF